MKNTIARTVSFIVITALLCAYSSNGTQNQATTPADDYKQLDTIVPFSGCWLNEDYYKSILKLKSPKEAQTGALFIVIPDSTRQTTTMIYNFHEGGMGIQFLKNNDVYEAWAAYNTSLVEKLYTVENISDSRIKLGDETFVKISCVIDDGYPKVLEEILFRGVYTDANGETIEFKGNGEVTGLDDFHFYQPAIDYIDAGMQVDQVAIGKSQKELEDYAFRFSGDTLKIYELECLTFDSIYNRCVEADYGDLVYQLWPEY